MNNARTMEFLKSAVYRALLENPNLSEEYAREFAVVRLASFGDLFKLDAGNQQLLADELGVSHAEFDGFMRVVFELNSSVNREPSLFEEQPR